MLSNLKLESNTCIYLEKRRTNRVIVKLNIHFSLIVNTLTAVLYYLVSICYQQF